VRARHSPEALRKVDGHSSEVVRDRLDDRRRMLERLSHFLDIHVSASYSL
jgi:hypothetical protein